MPQGLTANHERERLRASNSTHACDDRHQDRQRNHLRDRRLEHVDDGGGKQRGHEVDPEPYGASPGGLHDRREGIVLHVETSTREHRLVRFVDDDVHDVVDRDPADDLVRRVDDGSGNQVLFGEHTRDLGVAHRHGDRFDVRVHRFAHCDAGVRGQQSRQRQHANVFVLFVHDDQRIRTLGQRPAPTQITQHHLDRVPRPDCDRVGVHQTTGAVFRIGQHGFDALAVERIHRRE
jgi:hypothetical protein